MGPTQETERRGFRCNICGAANMKVLAPFGREVPSCDGCGSSVRTRALVRMLAREIFGADLALPDLPVLKSLRGIGMSDSEEFAARLAAKFDYRNTHFDKAPRLDVLQPSPHDIGAYDFIVSSEVLEHVVAPVERAFDNLFRMLKPDGLLLMTVPYRPAGDVQEHFGPMQDFALAELNGRTILVRRGAGGYEVLDDLVFHGGHGATLEMRVFSDASLRASLAGAGFECRVYTEDAPGFGIVHDETWSLPIAARKGRLAFGSETRAEWAEQWASRRNADLDRERGVSQDLRDKLNRRNADTQALVADFDRRMAERDRWIGALQAEVEHHKRLLQEADARPHDLAAAKAVVDRVEAELKSRTESADALQRELAFARERAVVLETLLRQRFWSRLKRRLGLSQG